MTELTLWKKEELDRLRRDLDSMFRRFRQGFGVPRTLLERADLFRTLLSETEDFLELKAELPGIRAENIQLSVTDDTLRLTVKTSEDSVEQSADFKNIVTRTRSYTRSITLPCRIVAENVKATFQDGLLEIKLPKCRPQEARGVTIEVK